MAFATSALTSLSQAALINLNFTATTDTPVESTISGPAGGLGTEWNLSTTADTGVLVDSTGAATGVSVDTSGYDAASAVNDLGATLPIYRSYLSSFARPSSYGVAINGLTANGLYDIWLLSYRTNTTSTERSVGTWATTNTTSSSSSQLVNATALAPGSTAFSEGYNYVLFSNVQATAGGVITFTGQSQGFGSPQDANSRRLHLNGLQINAVPEPSSALLGTLGMLALLRRRR